jgi:hypothetical protein
VNSQGCGSKHLVAKQIHHPKQFGGNVNTTRKPKYKIYTLGLERFRKEISVITEK